MTTFGTIDNTLVIILLLLVIAYLATVAYWERGDYDRIEAQLEKLHHAHLDLNVQHNKLNTRCLDLQRELRNAEARLAQAAQSEAATQPPVVCISVYKYNHLFSDN